ncbi:hypothetical protein [Corallococcus interemptor]|uniref:hypothetical protein n=1 Tax=Corallococcus interemptor TaxID=2316720 RepID=UPI00131506C7|nr:hypothetical protein [Corallococcus interemptor]
MPHTVDAPVSRLEVLPVPGNHQTMIEPPHVETLARHLTTCLRRIEDAAPESSVA